MEPIFKVNNNNNNNNKSNSSSRISQPTFVLELPSYKQQQQQQSTKTTHGIPITTTISTNTKAHESRYKEFFTSPVLKVNEIDIGDLLVPTENDSSWLCTICLSLMVNPLQCSNGHLNCKICWGKVTVCPVCRVSVCGISQLCRNQFYNDLFSKLKFNCQYKSNGCELILKHETLNQHLGICEYKTVECKLCLVKFMDKDSKQHLDQCGLMNGFCDKCSRPMTRNQFKDHIDKYQCKKSISTYCNNCGMALYNPTQHTIITNTTSTTNSNDCNSNQCILLKLMSNLYMKDIGLLNEIEISKIESIKNQILALSSKVDFVVDDTTSDEGSASGIGGCSNEIIDLPRFNKIMKNSIDITTSSSSTFNNRISSTSTPTMGSFSIGTCHYKSSKSQRHRSSLFKIGSSSFRNYNASDVSSSNKTDYFVSNITSQFSRLDHNNNSQLILPTFNTSNPFPPVKFECSLSLSPFKKPINK